MVFYVLDQQVVMPYYAAYQEVRKSVIARSSMGPVNTTLRHGLPKDSSDWDEVTLSQKNKLLSRWQESLLPKEWEAHSWRILLV